MENKKLIIILVTVIIVAVILAGTAIALTGVNPLNTNKEYNFNQYTMNVPSNAVFTNTSNATGLLPGQTIYSDINDSLITGYAFSEMFQGNSTGYMSDLLSKQSDFTPLNNITNLSSNCKIYQLASNNTMGVKYIGTYCQNNSVVIVGANDTDTLKMMLNSVNITVNESTLATASSSQSSGGSSNSGVVSSGSSGGSSSDEDYLTEADFQESSKYWGAGDANPNYGKTYHIMGGIYRDDNPTRDGPGDLTPVDERSERIMEDYYLNGG